MSETPFGKFERVSQPTAQDIDVPRMLAEKTPKFHEAAWAVSCEQLALVSQIASDESTHEAVRLLFNLAVNDFRDLLHDLGSGSGRSAMRAARAVVEHGINMHSVTGSLAEASRYLEHLDQGPAIMGDLATGVDRLDRKARRSYQHALSKSGAPAARRFDAAVAEHGSWFQRGWTHSNLKDRADLYGLEHLHDYYRLASLVAHGSAGGSLGSIRDHPDGFRIFRAGPALELAPVAMWAGIAGYREVLTGLQKVRTDMQMNAYTSWLDVLDELWADYFTALTEIDRAMWPREEVRPPTTVLAFTKTKARRWYLHLPMAASLIPAKEPDLPAWIEDQVTGLIDKVVAEQPYMFRSDQRWLTAEFLHVTVTPAEGARPIPDTALMEFPPDGWEPREIGSVSNDDS